jgi:hypothetical protein
MVAHRLTRFAPPLGTTPYENRALAVGHHIVYVRKGGFVAVSSAVAVGRNETVRVQLTLAPAVAPPPAQVDEERRLKRMAEEYAVQARRQRTAEEDAARARLKEASRAGRPLRIAGPALFSSGIVIVGIGFAIVADAKSHQDDLKQFKSADYSNGDPTVMWNAQADASVAALQTDSRAMLSLICIGGALIVGGSAVWIAGSVVRTRAEERARQPTLALTPFVSPTMAGLALGGTF